MLKIPFIARGKDVSDSEYRKKVAAGGCEVKVNVVNWVEYSYMPEVGVRIAHDGLMLWCLFVVKENHVRVRALTQNGSVWEDSCVELFIAHPNGREYFNFETNAGGIQLGARRRSRTDFNLLSSEELDSTVCLSSLSAKEMDLRDDNGIKWSLFCGVPFALLGYEEGVVPTTMRLNLYKCGDLTDKPHFLSWAPVPTDTPDFHRPEFFREVALEPVP